MIALAIVIAALLIIALLRFGVRVEYSSEGILGEIRIGPFSIKVYPMEKDPDKEEKKALKKAEKKAKKDAAAKDKPPKKMGLGLRDFMDMIAPVLKMLGRVRRRLLIKELTLHMTVAGDDASKIAMTYGAANAAIGELTPLLENNFRIKKRDIAFHPDFISEEQTIYANVIFSMAVWESLYIVFALFPIIKILFRRRPVKKGENKDENKDGKGDKVNGKAPNQQPNGDDNAKSQGDG
ncbi:MAG: DUF2953 domain-containing protein [Oscillospiraceae bacterium]|nr:DUF2953 domain-containing protein [Oscillospiraceae bacterium]